MKNMKHISNMQEKALMVAMRAHEGKVDKAGAPYVFHPIRVCEACRSEVEKVVALLHDVVEDSDISLDELGEMGFSSKVIDAVDSVSRRDGESYEDFIRRCSANDVGRAVKLHDLEDNMDISRLEKLSGDDIRRLSKYHKAYMFLKGK